MPRTRLLARSPSQEPLRDLIIRLLDPYVAQLAQEARKGLVVLGGDLDPRQDLGDVRAVVPVVEEGDVPPRVQGQEELPEGAGAFGEFWGWRTTREGEVGVSTGEGDKDSQRRRVWTHRIGIAAHWAPSAARQRGTAHGSWPFRSR